MSGDFVQYAYLLSAVLLILGMRNLGSPKTAPCGNLLASLGMAVAVVATLLIQEVVSYWTVFAGMLVGSAIGLLLALRIQMTAMPQMVALLNGFGGAASAGKPAPSDRSRWPLSRSSTRSCSNPRGSWKSRFAGEFRHSASPP